MADLSDSVSDCIDRVETLNDDDGRSLSEKPVGDKLEQFGKRVVRELEDRFQLPNLINPVEGGILLEWWFGVEDVPYASLELGGPRRFLKTGISTEP